MKLLLFRILFIYKRPFFGLSFFLELHKSSHTEFPFVNSMKSGEYLLLLFLLWPVFAMAYYLTCHKHRRDDLLSRNSLNSSNHKTEAVTVRSDDVNVTITAEVESNVTNPMSAPSSQVQEKHTTNQNNKDKAEVKNIKV